MLDIGWSELLIIGMVALVVVGPKELPGLLRTLGQYLGIVRRHAAEFRSQFDEAMRDTELQQLKQEVDSLRSEAEGTLRSAGSMLEGGDDATKTKQTLDYDDEDLDLDVGEGLFEPRESQVAGPGSAAVAAAAAAAERDSEGVGAETPDQTGAASAAAAAAAAGDVQRVPAKAQV